MFNFTLFINTLKAKYKLIIIFLIVLTFYFTVTASMYNPDNAGAVETFGLSPEALSAFGFAVIDSSLLGFLGSFFYGFIALAFPMVFYIILANSLVAGYVDKGSMAVLLSTPNTRKRVVVTQAVFLVKSISVLIVYITVLGLVVLPIMFPDLLDVKGFILLNLGLLLIHFAISGICFFASCLFNESKNSLMLGAGLPIGFLLIQMLSNISPDLDKLKYFSIFTLFNPTNIINGENFAVQFIALAVIGIALYGAGIFIFNKKDLPI